MYIDLPTTIKKIKTYKHMLILRNIWSGDCSSLDYNKTFNQVDHTTLNQKITMASPSSLKMDS